MKAPGRPNAVKRWRLRNQIRVAAKKQATGALSEVWYAVIVTHVMFELAGRVLQPGDSVNVLDFELVVPRALGLPTAYQWASAELLREYGPYGQAPMVLRNATDDYTWGEQSQALYEAALPLVLPLPRLEARIAKLKTAYPSLTGVGVWLASLIVAGIIGALISRFL